AARCEPSLPPGGCPRILTFVRPRPGDAGRGRSAATRTVRSRLQRVRGPDPHQASLRRCTCDVESSRWKRSHPVFVKKGPFLGKKREEGPLPSPPQGSG